MYAQRKAVVLGADGGIPGFWGTVIEHHHLMQEEITEKDQGVLRHLQEVAWEPLVEEGKEGFKLKFFFEENPYFDNEVLEKTYVMKADEDDVLEEAVGTEIAWKKGKNVTVKVMKKKVKKKGKESGPPITKTVKEDSFFNFFDPPDVAALEELDEDEDEEAIEQLQDLIEEDYEMGCCVKDEIIPHAVRWYTGEAYGSEDEDESGDEDGSEDEEDSEEYSDEDSEEDSAEDSEGEEEEEGSNDEALKGRKGKKGKGKKGEQKEQECKQQ